MKTFLIIVLSLALAAAAFFTCPSQVSFRNHVRTMMAAEAGSEGQRALLTASADDYLGGCEFKDRYLWVSVTRDGQAMYTGAFAHWFDHGRLAELKRSIERAAAKAEEV